MVTQTQYADFKKVAIENQPIRKTILLSDLKFLTLDTVQYAGLTLGFSTNALKNVVNLIGFKADQTATFQQAVGEDGAINLLNGLKNIISKTKREVIISVNSSRIITNVVEGGSKQGNISVVSFFDTFEKFANDREVDIKSTHFNPENGRVSISTSLPKNEFQTGNLKDEVFNPGLDFTAANSQIEVSPYILRLVCTNGIIGRTFEENYKITQNSTNIWQDFYRHIETLESQGFVPSKFNDSAILSQEHTASLAELERGIRMLSDNSKIPADQLEIFFPGMSETYRKWNHTGIDTRQLSKEQKRNCRTAITHWDLINGITDFASHDYGYEIKPGASRHLQKYAGDMLSKGPDTANLIPSQPF